MMLPYFRSVPYGKCPLLRKQLAIPGFPKGTEFASKKKAIYTNCPLVALLVCLNHGYSDQVNLSNYAS
jgi:hypothetical protein